MTIKAQDKISVVHFHRRPEGRHHSIERLFREIRNQMPDDIKCQAYVSRFKSRYVLPRIACALEAAMISADVLHITGDIHFAALACTRRPVVLTIHDVGILRRHSGFRKLLYEWFWYRLPIAKATLITCVSESTKQELIQLLQCSPDRIQVIHNCVPPAYKFEPKDFNEQAPTILVLGTAPNKNLRRVAQALKGLACKVRLVGTPCSEDHYAFRENRINLDILGNIEDNYLHAEFQAADIVLFPSTLEGFGLPIIEGQAIGRVVITSNCSSMPEIAGKGAILVDPLSVSAIRNGIEQVIQNKSLRDFLIEAGLENIKRFDAARVAKLYASAYRSVMKPEPTGSKKGTGRSVQVTIFSAESQGGLYVSVNRFRAALSKLTRHTLIDINFERYLRYKEKGIVPVRISSGILGAKFGFLDANSRWILKENLRDAAFVIIHVPYRFHSYWVASLCRKAGIPYVFVAHGALDPYVLTYRRYRKMLWLSVFGRKMIRNSASAIYSSANEERKALKLIGPHRSRVLYWPVPIRELGCKKSARTRIDRKLGLPENCKILLYLGRLHSMKRPLETITLFDRLNRADWILIIAGPDDEYKRVELEKWAADCRGVCVVGPVFGEVKDDLLDAADLMVLLSKRENFGFSVVESLSRSVPVMISDELDLAGEINNAKAGYVINVSEKANLSLEMSRILDAPSEEFIERGRNGRSWVQQNCSTENFEDELNNIISKIV